VDTETGRHAELMEARDNYHGLYSAQFAKEEERALFGGESDEESA
jgi:hypothetical protein